MTTTVERKPRVVTAPAQASSALISLKAGFPVALAAVASFHAAYEYPRASFLIVVYVFCLFRLTHLETVRQAFYGGDLGRVVSGSSFRVQIKGNRTIRKDSL